MDIVYSALVFLHMLAMAGIIAGWLMQQLGGNPKAPKVLLHSSITQLIVGLLLVGVGEMGDAEFNHAKIAAKLVLALAVVVFAVLNLRKPNPRTAAIAGILTVLNIGVAVFW